MSTPYTVAKRHPPPARPSPLTLRPPPHRHDCTNSDPSPGGEKHRPFGLDVQTGSPQGPQGRPGELSPTRPASDSSAPPSSRRHCPVPPPASQPHSVWPASCSALHDGRWAAPPAPSRRLSSKRAHVATWGGELDWTGFCPANVSTRPLPAPSLKARPGGFSGGQPSIATQRPGPEGGHQEHQAAPTGWLGLLPSFPFTRLESIYFYETWTWGQDRIDFGNPSGTLGPQWTPLVPLIRAPPPQKKSCRHSSRPLLPQRRTLSPISGRKRDQQKTERWCSFFPVHLFVMIWTAGGSTPLVWGGRLCPPKEEELGVRRGEAGVGAEMLYTFLNLARNGK